MGVRIEQLSAKLEMNKLNLVSGRNGTHKLVRWVHVVETPDLLQYVQSDELIILTGMGLSENISDFIVLIEGLIKKDAVGLILNIGKYFERVPDEIKKISDENEFPIFELPWEVSIAEITKVICEEIVKRQIEEKANQDLLMDILFFNKVSYEDFIMKMTEYSYEVIRSYRIVIVTAEGIPYDWDNQKMSSLKQVLHNSINSAASDSRYRAISYPVNESIILLVLNEKERQISMDTFSDVIRECCKKNFPEMNFNISIGNVYNDFSQIRKSYVEADKAFKAAKAEKCTDCNTFYSDIGVYKLLAEIENAELLERYHQDILGKLERYDIQNKTDFMNLLYVFLQEGGGYNQTANRLFMHRNTVMYKVNKIQEILGCDLSDPQVTLELKIGFMIKKLLSK